MNTENVRLWHALGLGPRWRECDHIAPRAGLPVDALSDSATKGNGGAGPTAAPAGAHVTAALDWDGLAQAVAACTACGLCRTRTQTVFGVGQQSAHWLFVGEAPGSEEDARGEPFVGQAGRLLDNMLAAVGLARDQPGAAGAFIANVLKCRPPGNRNPEAHEVDACVPFLQRQLALLQPRIVVLMGRFAAQAVLTTDASIGSLRGRVHELRIVTPAGAGRRVPVVVTYHPAYLLRSLAEKSKAWEDLCLARAAYANTGAQISADGAGT